MVILCQLPDREQNSLCAEAQYLVSPAKHIVAPKQCDECSAFAKCASIYCTSL